MKNNYFLWLLGSLLAPFLPLQFSKTVLSQQTNVAGGLFSRTWAHQGWHARVLFASVWSKCDLFRRWTDFSPLMAAHSRLQVRRVAAID